LFKYDSGCLSVLAALSTQIVFPIKLYYL